MKKKLHRLSLISFIISLVIFAGSYYIYHFISPSGLSLVWQPECGKPFITELFANLGVLFFFTSIISLIIAYVFYSDDRK